MSESVSKSEKDRMKIILAYLLEEDSVSNAIVAELLDVRSKTANRLLVKAETVGILKSQGKTKDKRYNIK
jgi:Predicted transcriptional regulator containing an HTH domain and an uncharacterized domain shared with the mammalian protein Schlafen